ncbi:Cyclin [Quillaja saponaria]|uniref:B-like cyclin n=1 Tax=Quillaja saponaria TaxID=32244 RepID=A0AAD7KYI5_QUISA|nr:Cyclin [Quillaja saponaria]
MEFDIENPLANSNDLQSDAVPSLFLAESEHTPSENYLQSLKARDYDISVRREVISLISKFCCNLDPVLSYLAVNYLDRFLSSQGMLQPKSWVLRLVALTCISLAAKMTKTEFSITDIQGDGGIIFDKQTIQRMEVLILGALKWRMRSITPFSFIPFFICLFKLKDPPLMQALKARATEIIFKSQSDVKLLEFKPSIIAVSALLSTSHELLPLHYADFRKALSNCSFVNKEYMLQCYNVVQDITMDGYEYTYDIVSSWDTPVNVLDHHFLSSESENYTNGTTHAIVATSPIQERDIKRRKINDYGNNHTVQLSQSQRC